MDKRVTDDAVELHAVPVVGLCGFVQPLPQVF